MSIPLTGTGGLFTRLGRIARAITRVNSQQVGNIVADVDLLSDEYEERRELIDTLPTKLAGYQQGQLGLPEFLKTVAQNTVIQMVNEDNPQEDSSLATALVELITQMQDAGETVEKNTCNYAITPAATNNSDASVVVSVISRRGNPLQNLLEEDINITVTTDAQEGAATEGQETLTAESEISATNKLNADWPMGSDITVSLSAIDANTDNSANLLTNGNFAIFGTETAYNWILENGDLVQTDASGLACVSNDGLSFTGDGASTFALSQIFNDSVNGTAAALRPLSQYAVNLWLNVDSVPAAGELTVELLDSDTGLVVADDAGSPNAFVVDLTMLDAFICTPVGDFFRTPRIMPANMRLRIRLSTAISNGVTLTMDHVAMGVGTELYTHGPWVAVFSGSLQSIREDNWTVSILNDRAGLIQTSFERLFDMNDKRLQLPVEEAGTAATIDDSLFQ